MCDPNRIRRSRQDGCLPESRAAGEHRGRNGHWFAPPLPPKPDEDFVVAPAKGVKALFTEVAGDFRLSLLEQVDPLRAAALRRFLGDLEALRQGRVLMSAPFWIPRLD